MSALPNRRPSTARGAHRAARAQDERATDGFTLIELAVVLALLGVLFVFVLPNMELLSPRYAMRAAAREIASTIDLCRSEAAGSGRTFAIRYELDRQTYTVFGPRGADDDGAGREPGPWGTWAVGAPRKLPEIVRIVAVRPDVTDAVTGGELAVRFSPLGFEGSHVVVLENRKGDRLSVKYSAIIGVTDYYEGEVTFKRAEGR